MARADPACSRFDLALARKGQLPQSSAIDTDLIDACAATSFSFESKQHTLCVPGEFRIAVDAFSESFLGIRIDHGTDLVRGRWCSRILNYIDTSSRVPSNVVIVDVSGHIGVALDQQERGVE